MDGRQNTPGRRNSQKVRLDSIMDIEALNKVAIAMVEPGKGLLAADESFGTIGKRFASIDTENTEDNRRDWREMLFRTDKAMKEHVSGVIKAQRTELN